MENTRIVEMQRKTQLKAEEIQLFKESFVIVPYQPSGFLNYTNQGYNEDNIDPNDFETFKRIWTGNDVCNISWKNSIFLEQNEQQELEIKFQLGEVFLGTIQTNDGENRIQTDASFSEYKAQDIRKTINFYVNKQFNITDYYQLMFYKIPEYSGSTLYRLSNIERDYVGKELVGYVLSFETINQDLANTGKAKQQNIMPNSPGQGYLECVVEDSTWPERLGKEEFEKLQPGIDYYKLYDRYITADYQKTLNNPARKVVVKLLGNGMLNSIVMEGRPVLSGDSFTKYRDKRLLFPYDFKPPSTPNIFHTQNNVNNFYFGTFSPTLEYWKDLMLSVKDSLTPQNTFNYQGWLTYDYDKLKSTNPIENDKYKFDLYGYLDTTTSPTLQKPWKFSVDEEQIDTSGVYGVEQTYNIGGEKEIHNHLFDNFWTQKMIKVLPTTITNTLTFGLTLASAVGLALRGGTTNYINAAILGAIGISGTLIGKLKQKNIKGIRGIVPAALIDFNNGAQGAGFVNKIPFNFLDNNNEETPNNAFFAGNTLSTSFEARITDLFVSERVKNDDGSYKTLSTLNIGQKTFEDGTNILPSGLEFNLNGDAKLLETYDDYSGYIIDNIKIQAIFNGDISIEFLDVNENVIWSGVYQSEGKWTNSMREIWTEKNTSVFGKENILFGEPVSYPKELTPPPPTFPVGVLTEIDVNDTKMYNSYKLKAGYVSVVSDFAGGVFIEPNQSYWWKNQSTNVNVVGKVIKDNITKEELLQVYSVVEFEVAQQKYNLSMFDLFSNPNNEYTLTKEKVSVKSDRYKVPYGAIPIFPVGELFLRLKCTINFTIKIYWQNNQLLCDFSGIMIPDKPTIRDETTGGSWTSPSTEQFLFGNPGGSFNAGLSSLILYPK